MFDILGHSEAIATLISVLALFWMGRSEFERQKKHEFRLEVAKTLFQNRWVLVPSNMPDAAAMSEFNRALGAVQLAFADNVEIRNLLNAFATMSGNRDMILALILEKISALVNLKVDAIDAGTCLACKLSIEIRTTNANVSSSVNNTIVSSSQNSS